MVFRYEEKPLRFLNSFRFAVFALAFLRCIPKTLEAFLERRPHL
jgi:hypothetical protein